ncbi:MAG: NAD-dependent epimerase/dehydratase family protein [Gammaproteobacteria bacterium]|nr:NAD-dependent epimerase/dehydratase family protein [Gammaproteobacteria bacterium]
MKVFVTGATGYIGSSVASAFRRAGHEVWGLTRSNEKAKQLARDEIHPVVGSLQQPQAWLSVAEQAAVLVHAAVDYEADVFALDRKTVDTLISIGNSGAQPKMLVYTSGVWVHGDTRGQVVDETTLPTPVKFVTARTETEQRLLAAAGVRGIVIRPGVVYGKRGGLTGIWFNAAVDGGLTAVGDGKNHWAMIHVDDLAELYVGAVEQQQTGEIFNAVDRSRSNVADMVSAVARAAGYTGKINYVPVDAAREKMGDFAEALAIDQRVDSSKAERLLNWQPRHRGFVEDVALYFEAWRAAH